MRKFTKSIDDLLHAMFLMGKGDNVKLNKRQKTILTRVDICDLNNLLPAWVCMSTQYDANIVTFSHCLFNGSYPYTSDIYARLLGETAFRKLESWMLTHGYKRFDIYNVTASDCKLSLSIANPKWSEEPPRGGFEYKIKHTGISAQFDDYVKTPAVFGLCIPNGMKTYLETFDEMDKELQSFVVQRTKRCDNCKYCVQTDKTGLRPKAYISVEFEEKSYHLCTYFPGYNYSWSSIDENLANEIIRMLSFMDRFIPFKTGGRK